MTIKTIFSLALFFLLSCKAKEDIKYKDERKSPYKPYQEYALNRINEADFDDQGFSLTDSFYLWSYDDFGREFRQNRVTRTFEKSAYYYTFWTHNKDTSLIYMENSVISSQFIKDTLFDINKDGAKDLIVILMGEPKDSIIYNLDTALKRFSNSRR